MGVLVNPDNSAFEVAINSEIYIILKYSFVWLTCYK